MAPACCLGALGDSPSTCDALVKISCDRQRDPAMPPRSHLHPPEVAAMPKQFKGTINLDVRDSTPDWDAFLPDKAPRGAPNVLVILYDDTGQAAWSPYGGRINMP